MTSWVKLRDARRLSWHTSREVWTRCGLRPDVDAPRANDLPTDERSCESCLRLMALDERRGRRA